MQPTNGTTPPAPKGAPHDAAPPARDQPPEPPRPDQRFHDWALI